MRIVVLGGGYAGMRFLRTVRNVAGDAVELLLVDRAAHHTLLVETHKVAAGRLKPDDAAIPFSVIPGVRHIRATATGIHPSRKTVETTSGDITYDVLVVALGSVDHDHGVPGAREHALTLRSAEDAARIAERVERLGPGSVCVIVGGGLTGVELAAELALHRPSLRMFLVEASSDILPGLPPALRKAARRRLGELGVNLLTQTPVSRVEPATVLIERGLTIPHDLLIWAGGVQANPLIADLPGERDRSGRLSVPWDGQTADPDVYVIGDCASGPWPPSAQMADQQGRAAALSLLRRLGYRVRVPRPRVRGLLVSVGGDYGLGRVGALDLAGLFPAWLKRWVELAHVHSVGGRRAWRRRAGS